MAVSFGFRAGSLALGSGGGGSEPILITKNITSNETYNASDDNADGYSSVTVAVPIPEPVLMGKTITESGTYSASDDNADGYNEVIVNTSSPADLLALVQNASSISNGVYITDTVLKSEATSIRRHTFRELAIYDIDMENITSVSPYAFAFSNGIISNGRIRLPSCTTIGESAFEDYSRSGEAITTFELPLVTSIGNNAFKRAKLQVPLSLPECITVGDSSFREVPLTGLSLPKCQYIYNSGFRDVYFSSDISLPAIKTIGNYAFSHTQCTNFTIGPDCTSIGGDLFMSRNGVTNLYVLATTPPSLAWGFKSGGGGVQHIYVPEDSVDAYKAASTWSNYASVIEAIPEA